MGEFLSYVTEKKQKVIDEIAIDPNSSLRKKFATFAKKYFLPEELDEAVKVDNSLDKLSKSDIELFVRYCFLKRKGANAVSLTNKGLAVLVGMKVDTKDHDDKFHLDQIKKYIAANKKDNDPNTVKGWLKIIGDNKVIYLDHSGKKEIGSGTLKKSEEEKKKVASEFFGKMGSVKKKLEDSRHTEEKDSDFMKHLKDLKSEVDNRVRSENGKK